MLLGEADEITCGACEARAPLPTEYRDLREARRLSDAGAASLDAVAAEVARPTPLWKPISAGVGYAVGGATLVVFAIGALLGALLGVGVASKLDLGNKGAGIVVAIFAAAIGMMSLPFVGEYVLVYAHHGVGDVALAVASGEQGQWGLDALVGVLLYVLSIAPIALSVRATTNLAAVKELRERLRARQPEGPSGSLGCRGCGAPLEVRAGAIAARCLYCGTDSLVALPPAVASKAKDVARTVDKEVSAEIDKHRASKQRAQAVTRTVLLAGLSIIPVVVVSGWLLHAVVGD